MTKFGVIKRTQLVAFSNIRRGGLFAINLREGDELHGVRLTDGTKEIIAGTRKGMSIRFHEEDVRLMGRTATGVKGVTLQKDDEVVGMDIIEEDQHVLIVTEKGFGKRTPVEDYRVQTRGGKGIKTCNITEKNGDLVSLKVVADDHDLMIITNSGVIIRMHVNEISITSRNTQGVKLIRVAEEENEKVSTVARVNIDEDDEVLADEETVEGEAPSDSDAEEADLTEEIEETEEDGDVNQ